MSAAAEPLSATNDPSHDELYVVTSTAKVKKITTKNHRHHPIARLSPITFANKKRKSDDAAATATVRFPYGTHVES
jgi:hypothetical protein